MRKDSIRLEESRVHDGQASSEFPPFKERHRIFPAVFEGRNHKRILDLAAGIGYVTQRLLDQYPATVISHDISPSCLEQLRARGAPTLCFDIDDAQIGLPFRCGAFDAVISLVTVEHLLFVNEFLCEINRILCDGGYLYIAAPNYAAFEYLVAPLMHARSFHDPMHSGERYEFYAHVRYFTFITLKELAESMGFVLDTVYIGLPAGSDRFRKMQQQSSFKAQIFHDLMWLKAKLLTASRASEPILCLKKSGPAGEHRYRTVLL